MDFRYAGDWTGEARRARGGHETSRNLASNPGSPFRILSRSFGEFLQIFSPKLRGNGEPRFEASRNILRFRTGLCMASIGVESHKPDPFHSAAPIAFSKRHADTKSDRCCGTERVWLARLTGVIRSYSSCPFLCALELRIGRHDTAVRFFFLLIVCHMAVTLHTTLVPRPSPTPVIDPLQ